MKNRAQTRALAVIAITLAAALSACGSGEDNVANDPAAREAMVKAAQCLREAGYDVKDPQAGEGISVKDIPEDVLNKCFQQSGAAK